MQVGFTIGQLLSESKMQILFAFPALHLNEDKCASGITDLRYIVADCTNANRV